MAPIVATPQNEEIRVSNREEDSMNNEPSLSGKTIVGLIIPPPDIRNIVDKTALFVARNGIDFENKIKEKEATNVRFNFLSPTDPYHAYYKNKVVECETGVPIATTESVGSKIPDAVREHIEKVEFVPKNPPKPNEFTADPSTINAFDLDLIRLTALFVARNGRQFLTQLMNREVRNYQFDFLKPQHSNFQYFQKLVEQYTKVLIPAKNIVNDLRESATHKKVIADVNYRVGWEKHQRAMKDREDAEVEQERLAYSQIDWHDFVVVQTVDFQPSETLNLPGLCTPKDVGARILLQQRSEAAKAAAESVAMEMDSDSEEGEGAEGDEDGGVAESDFQSKLNFKDKDGHPMKNAYEVNQPLPAAPTPSNVVIRDYDPKKGRTSLPHKALSDDYIISPLTGEKIPAVKLQEHVRFNTVDPQYKEQRDREQLERQDDDPTSASGTEISRNIAKLAERRTDIFGVGEQGAQQTIIGKKLGEEEHTMPRSDSKTIWDGQQSTIDATTRAAQQAITLDQQINEIQRQHGYQADPSRERIGPKDTALPPLPASAIPALPISTTATSTLPPPVPSSAPPPPMPPAAPKPTIGSNVARIMPVPVRQTPPAAMAPPMGGMAPPMPIIPQVVVPNNPFHPPIPHHQLNMPAPPSTSQYDDGPPSKRARPEESLESEESWLRKVSGVVNLSVATPATQEWNLNGQTFNVSLDITSLVSALKSQVQEQTSVPSSKQKLVYEGFFMKDNFTLAYYNAANNGNIQLQIKERGGRKK